MKERKKRKSELDPYIEEIKERLSIVGTTIKGTYWYFKNEMKIKTTYSNFKHYVRVNHLFEKRSNEAHVLFETDPGEQLQVDWVEDIKLSSLYGEIYEFNLFSATLGCSRYHYFEYTNTKTEVDFKRGLVNCFKAIGGKTNHILTDNMSAIVDVRNGKRYKHQSIIQFEKNIEVPIILCDVRHPMTKGKDEVSNKFAKWLKAYDGKIRNKDHLLSIIKQLNKDINLQVNTGTKHPPVLLFEKEKEYLKPLGNLDFQSIIEENMYSYTVPSTLLIPYKGKKYSVPQKYNGCHIKFYESNNILYFYYNKELITKHEMSKEKINNYDIEHYKQALSSRNMKDDKIEEYAKRNIERLK